MERLDISLVIPGVKKPGPFSSSANRNCIVDAKFESQSLRILIHLNSAQKHGHFTRTATTVTKYLYKIQRLPDKIIPESSTFRLGKNKVVITIRKAKQGSWQHVLDTRGLETLEEDY